MKEESNVVSIAPPKKELLPGIPRETAMRAMRAWALGFGLEDVAAILGYEAVNALALMEMDEWHKLRDEMRFALEQELAASWLRTGALAMREVHARIEHGRPLLDKAGEPVVDKDGKAVMVGIAAKDLAALTNTVINSRALLMKGSTKDPGEKDDDKLTMKEIAEGLKRYVRAKDITPAP